MLKNGVQEDRATATANRRLVVNSHNTTRGDGSRPSHVPLPHYYLQPYMSYAVDSTALRLKPTSSELTPHRRQRPSEITTVPSTKDIWTWTLTSEATAPCHVRDVFEMTENPNGVCYLRNTVLESQLRFRL